MTFEEWWKEMKPAECDEVKPSFEQCWNTAVEEAASEYETQMMFVADSIRSIKIGVKT
jgi:hypothetical protein